MLEPGVRYIFVAARFGGRAGGEAEFALRFFSAKALRARAVEPPPLVHALHSAVALPLDSGIRNRARRSVVRVAPTAALIVVEAPGAAVVIAINAAADAPLRIEFRTRHKRMAGFCSGGVHELPPQSQALLCIVVAVSMNEAQYEFAWAADGRSLDDATTTDGGDGGDSDVIVLSDDGDDDDGDVRVIAEVPAPAPAGGARREEPWRPLAAPTLRTLLGTTRPKSLSAELERLAATAHNQTPRARGVSRGRPTGLGGHGAPA